MARFRRFSISRSSKTRFLFASAPRPSLFGPGFSSPAPAVSGAKRSPFVTETPARHGAPTLENPQGACSDGGDPGIACERPAPTMVIIIAGLCVMLFLVAIGIVLLLYSYYKYRRRRRLERNQEPANSSLSPDGSCPEPGWPDSWFLVYMPGHREPNFFARPCPLPSLDLPNKENPVCIKLGDEDTGITRAEDDARR